MFKNQMSAFEIALTVRMLYSSATQGKKIVSQGFQFNFFPNILRGPFQRLCEQSS